MPESLPQKILSALETVIPKGEKRPVALHEPRFAGKEWEYVKECLDTGWVSSVGKYVDRFEVMLSEQTGLHAVALGNGTSALHLSLLLAGVEPEDEALIPSLTFVATANAVRHAFAWPHLVDVEERTLGIDVAKLGAYLSDIAEKRGDFFWNKKTGRRLRAVVPMHAFGHPCDIAALAELCEKYNLALVEDAAESLGSTFAGKHTGSFGIVAALSFNGNKTVTTGGGGAILSRSSALAKRAKHLSTTAKIPHKWEFVHDEVGYNYRLPNINAALGCAQLEQLPDYLAQKRALAEKYKSAFAGVTGVKFFTEPARSHSNYWLNTLILDSSQKSQRDAILALTNDSGIMTRPTWTLMHKLVMYKDCPRMDLSCAEDLEKRVINIPSSPFLCPSEKK